MDHSMNRFIFDMPSSQFQIPGQWPPGGFVPPNHQVPYSQFPNYFPQQQLPPGPTNFDFREDNFVIPPLMSVSPELPNSNINMDHNWRTAPEIPIIPQNSPAYSGISSASFTSQVPRNCYPLLRFPPPKPPLLGQPCHNPYLTNITAANFASLFHLQLLDNFNPKNPNIRDLISNYRSLSLDNQLDEFLHCRSLTKEQVRIRWQLIMDIVYILRKNLPNYPESEVYAFGSVLSGLGDPDSDIDIYVNLPGSNSSAPNITSQSALFRVKKVFNRGLRCPHTGHPFLARPSIPIGKARVPILKCEHLATNISFDLSFENRLSAQNSRLVLLYIHLDSRVFSFMMIVRYWLKFHRLSGSDHIKNYAITLLCLVFLTRKGIIPSVHILQCLKAAQRKEQGLQQNPDEIEGWDTSFCEDLEYIFQFFTPAPNPPEQSPARHLMELCLEFFRDWANVDFGCVVVCTLLGEVVLKGAFIPGNEGILSEDLERYKKCVEQNPEKRLRITTPLCVQDPFVLSFNVCAGAGLLSVIKFQIACAKSAEVLQSKLDEGDGEGISLLDLFVPLPQHFKMKDVAKSYLIDRKLRYLKRQIFTALGMTTRLKGVWKEEEGMEQKNSYCVLPSHLQAMDKLMDKQMFAQWQMTHTDTDILQIYMMGDFSARIFENVPNGWKGDRLVLARKIAGLWKSFAEDYLKEFFEKGLMIQVIGEAKQEGPGERVDHLALSGLTSRAGWKVFQEKMGSHDVGKQEGEKFMGKMEQLEELGEDKETCYKIVSLQVDYPFWRGRRFRLEEWGKDEMKTMDNHGKMEYKHNPVEVEREISVVTMEKWQKEVGGNKENLEEDEEKDVEVVELEGQQQRKRKKIMDEEKFSPFSIDVLVKISSSLGHCDKGLESGGVSREKVSVERPGMFLVFQEGDATSRCYKHAVGKIISLCQSGLCYYQLHRLNEWIARE